jgi:hypothetical protein
MARIAAGGQLIAFSSTASNLVVSDSNGAKDVFLRGPRVPIQALQESPAEGSFESGVGLIRGWVCDADKVEIVIDGGNPIFTAYGTSRADTDRVCGDRNNGYGAVINWNTVGDGNQTLQAFADGVEFARVRFSVSTLSKEFLRGVKGQYVIPNFPEIGRSVTVRWSQAHQGFVIVGQ